MRVGDQTHRACFDLRFIADATGQGNLIARRHGNARPWNKPAGRNVNQVDTQRFRPAGKLDRLVQVPSSLGPVCGRGTYEKRPRLGEANVASSAIYQLPDWLNVQPRQCGELFDSRSNRQDNLDILASSVLARRVHVQRVELVLRCSPSLESILKNRWLTGPSPRWAPFQPAKQVVPSEAERMPNLGRDLFGGRRDIDLKGSLRDLKRLELAPEQVRIHKVPRALR